MNLAEVLTGRAGLEGLRWMLLDGVPRRALQRELKGLLCAPSALGLCSLRHASFRPPIRVKAYYDTYVRSDVAEKNAIRPIAVKWKLNGRASAAGLVDMQAEAVRQGVAAPFERLTADVPALCMRVQISPLDAQFRQLVRLSNPEYVGEMIARACGCRASDALRKEATAHRYAVRHLRYRPGKCHLLRYDSLDAEEPRTFFAKLYPGETGRKTFDVATQIGAWLGEHREGVTSARPIAYVAEDAIVLYPKVSGTPLFKRLRRPGRGVARWLKCAGTTLVALHQMPQAVSGQLEMYDFAAEIRDTAKASSHVPVLLPSGGAAIQALLDQAQELHERLPAEPPCFAHGDFKSEHLWVARGGLALIDLDSYRWADPALDIGKFLADLWFWHATHSREGLDEAQEQFLGGYGRPISGERLTRARVYEAVEMVRMTALRVALCDHDWAARTEHLIGQAQAVMNHVQGRLGLATKRHFALSSNDARRAPGASPLATGGKD